MHKKPILFVVFFFFSLTLLANESNAPASRKTICLNMIVKNESEVIERCLTSVKHLIDYWVIIDTGSNDGTQEIVKNFLKDIPGELLEKPWVDFAKNRNEALLAAKDKADYLLFLDADEIWQYSQEFSLPSLDKDAYYVLVRQLGAVDFKRIGLINTQVDWKWNGVLHEVLESSLATTYGVLNGVLNICNEVKGARSKSPDKYLKDAAVLEKALKDDPQNSRYVFYLGQSYLAGDKHKLALKAFEKRSLMQSKDVQETFMSIYNQGVIQEKLNNFDSAIESYFKAYGFRPTRAEPLFRASVVYRKKGNYLLGYLLSKFALSTPAPMEDLCIEYMTYDYALLIEFANCALLLGRFQEGFEACCRLLANPNLPPDIKNHVFGNLELARKNIVANEELQHIPQVK